MDPEVLYTLALTYVSGIGDITAKKLIQRAGSAKAVFVGQPEARTDIKKGLAAFRERLRDKEVLIKAEKEIEYCERNGIRILQFSQDNYPRRLRECPDGPVVLFQKGDCDLNAKKIVSIVGTRNATSYGKQICESLVRDLKDQNVIVVSGLAIGIDIAAHRACIANGIPTVAVVAHGLDEVYPPLHRKEVHEMIEKGGAIVSDFSSGSKLDKENFPKRNRIIAGLADASIVVEARETGGALITADIANSYSRDVFAFPGRISDTASLGCNALIRNNQAALACSAADIIKAMRWENHVSAAAKQQSLFVTTDPDEQTLLEIISDSSTSDIDNICLRSGFHTGKVASLLLNLELSGIIKSLPGKKYRLAQ